MAPRKPSVNPTVHVSVTSSSIRDRRFTKRHLFGLALLLSVGGIVALVRVKTIDNETTSTNTLSLDTRQAPHDPIFQSSIQIAFLTVLLRLTLDALSGPTGGAEKTAKAQGSCIGRTLFCLDPLHLFCLFSCYWRSSNCTPKTGSGQRMRMRMRLLRHLGTRSVKKNC